MLYDKDVESFRSIKAPKELKVKIKKELSLRENKKKVSAKSFSAVAACFAVVFSFLVFGFLSAGQPTLMYKGTEITDKVMCVDGNAPSMARAAISSGIPFEIKVKEETTLSVSDGRLLKEGKNERTEKLVLSEKGNETVYLSFEDEELPITLKAETEKETAIYILSYDEAKGYTIYKDATHKK